MVRYIDNFGRDMGEDDDAPATRPQKAGRALTGMSSFEPYNRPDRGNPQPLAVAVEQLFGGTPVRPLSRPEQQAHQREAMVRRVGELGAFVRRQARQVYDVVEPAGTWHAAGCKITGSVTDVSAWEGVDELPAGTTGHACLTRRTWLV